MLLTFFVSIICGLISTPPQELKDLKWKEVVFNQPDEWYGSDEAIQIAENVILYQRDVGGWPKNTPMHLVLAKSEKKKLRKLKSVGVGATTDNGATVMELTFLSKVYNKKKEEKYKTSFLKGIDYLLEAQFKNGSWPQFYPLRKGYYTHITYNDNSMVNVMGVMQDIVDEKFSIVPNEATVLKAKTAFEKGLKIILKTQYKQNGALTVWCAQHDQKTFLPVKARSYELPSLSGGESAGIVLLLMKLDQPSPEIIEAIHSAVRWIDQSKITGIRVANFKNSEGVKDRKVIEDKDAPPIWARFYDLDSNQPFFCDRDGIKKYSLAEIGHERRNGYSWYGYSPQAVLDEYKNWQPKLAPDNNVLAPTLKLGKKKSCDATLAEKKQFEELSKASWETVFSDEGINDYKQNWLLDGKKGYVENNKNGMALHAGPEIKNDAHHAVLWTKQSFSGDMMIEYDYTRLDSRDRQVNSVNIIYIQATGSEEGEYSKDIFQWNSLREVPSMRTYYNNMHTLHISYAVLTKDGDYIRARRYRPDRHKKMNGTELGSSFNIDFFETGIKHHITIIKKGYNLFMKVANEQQTKLYKWNYSGHPKIMEGRIGLRHMFSRSSQYKNFVVKELK